MISREEFSRVQQIIATRNRSLPHHHLRHEFPLRGCVRCPVCKRHMTSSFSRGRHNRYPYYRCGSKDCDNGTSYAATSVHAEFTEWLSGIAPKEERMASLKNGILSMAEERQKA